MELPFSTPAQVASAYCVPWNPSDPLENLYDQAAMQFNSDNDASLAAIIKVALQNQMMLYRKARCTDCATEGIPPTQTVINPPSNSGGAAPSGPVFTNTTDFAAQQATGFLQQGVSALGSIAKAGTGLAKAVPILGDVVSVISDIVGIFTAHHAQAVAEEQAVNCGVANAFNKWIPQYDLAVARGQMPADGALQAITQIIQTQLQPALDPVIKAHNWGWGANQVLQAHLWFRQQWYPMLESAASSPLSSLLSGEGVGSGRMLIVLAIAAGIAIFVL